jgi:hypothetical protein
MLRVFPLLIVPVVIYAVLALGGGVGMLAHGVDIPMFSQDHWHFSIGDLLVTVALVLLFAEIVKSTRTTSRQLINHGLSMVVFVIALVCFIALKGFATSTFFLILTMALFDVVAGYTISIVAAEHDLGVGRAGTD